MSADIEYNGTWTHVSLHLRGVLITNSHRVCRWSQPNRVVRQGRAGWSDRVTLSDEVRRLLWRLMTGADD